MTIQPTSFLFIWNDSVNLQMCVSGCGSEAGRPQCQGLKLGSFKAPCRWAGFKDTLLVHIQTYEDQWGNGFLWCGPKYNHTIVGCQRLKMIRAVTFTHAYSVVKRSEVTTHPRSWRHRWPRWLLITVICGLTHQLNKTSSIFGSSSFTVFVCVCACIRARPTSHSKIHTGALS